MLGIEITKEIFTSFVGTLIALISAAIVWSIKLSYEKHRAEIFALAKYERFFALNLTILKDNFEFVKKWIDSLSNYRPYSFSFGKFKVSDDETYKLSNLLLINRIIASNYKLDRTALDLDNLYKSYWETIFKIDSIDNEEKRNANFELYNKNVKEILETVSKNYETLRDDLIETIAVIRCAHRVRRYSLMGLLNLLFVDVSPRITRGLIEKEKSLVIENIQKKGGVDKSNEK